MIFTTTNLHVWEEPLALAVGFYDLINYRTMWLNLDNPMLKFNFHLRFLEVTTNYKMTYHFLTIFLIYIEIVHQSGIMEIISLSLTTLEKGTTQVHDKCLKRCCYGEKIVDCVTITNGK